MQPRLTSDNRLALLMHDTVTSPHGKMGFGLMRYGTSPTVIVIDRAHAGQDLAALTGIPCNAPIVATVEEALTYRPDTLIPAIAPAGGALPVDWWEDVKAGVAAGLSLVNPLHRPLADDPELAPLVRLGRFIWDVRQEPPGLTNGMGRARECSAKRVVMVGTDMANGKMTAAIELDRAAQARGLRSRFLATGQIGITIAGEGVPVDAVRVDFATGAVEQLVLQYGNDHDLLFVEGQGSVLHPASSAWLAIVRGAMPTHLILVHRAGQETVMRAPWVKVPPLPNVVRLYEAVAGAAGAFPPTRVAGIALNTFHLPEGQARQAVDAAAVETGLPVTDVVRFGAEPLIQAVMG
jgi:uncharacterized NAD-dependent epimerase/dehydratase family protein